MPIVESGADAQAPPLRAFSTLKNEVARFVMGPDDAEVLSVAGMGINSAIRKLNTRAWYWALTYQDITTVASTADYAIADNYKSSRSLHQLDSTGNPRGQIGYRDPKTFDTEFQDVSGTGDPCAYTVYSALDTFMLSLEIPCSASFVSSYPTLRHRYFARTPTLVSDADTGFWPSEVEEWAKWYARLEVASQFDPEKISIAKGEEREWWNLLIRDNTEHHFRDWEA